MKVLIEKGILSKFEDQFNRPRSNHRIDSSIDIRSQPEFLDLMTDILGTPLGGFDALFIDYVVPSKQNFHKSVMPKIDKCLLDNEHLLTIIFYGSYSSEVFDLAQQQLLSHQNVYKQNARFIDLIDFAKEFKFLTEKDLFNLKDINDLIKEALRGKESALRTLEEKLDGPLLDLERYKNRYLGGGYNL